MSNTTRVTPYASLKMHPLKRLKETMDRALSGADKIQGTIKWLLGESPAAAHITNRLKEERRLDRLDGESARISTTYDFLPMTTVELNLRQPESLMRSAEKLGYRPASADKPLEPLTSMDPILLGGPSGERLAVERNLQGRLIIHSTTSQDRIQSIIKQHTLDRALDHLVTQGMTVQTRSLPNGEIEIQACERKAPGNAAGAEVKLQVHSDGSAMVDIDKIRGKQCVQITDRLAKAMGAKISVTRKKGAFFQRPSRVSSKAKIGL